MQSFQEELNLDLMEASKIVIDHFPLHERMEVREVI